MYKVGILNLMCHKIFHNLISMFIKKLQNKHVKITDKILRVRLLDCWLGLGTGCEKKLSSLPSSSSLTSCCEGSVRGERAFDSLPLSFSSSSSSSWSEIARSKGGTAHQTKQHTHRNKANVHR